MTIAEALKQKREEDKLQRDSISRLRFVIKILRHNFPRGAA